MTTEDFERAQLRLDIEELVNRYPTRLAVVDEVIDGMTMDEALQAYFERRD